MIRHCTSTPQNALTIAVTLVALVLMILALTLVPGHAAAWVTTAGILLLVAGGFYSAWLARRLTASRGGNQ
jgi:hypothetical protein